MEDQLKRIVHKVTGSDTLHAKWLNSLSMMENTGARKISRYQHPVHTDLVVLKHAAEEARHAYYLKKLITRIIPEGYPDYSFAYLLAPVESYHYLHRLDTETSRYLQNKGLKGRDMKHGAYLLVTYAIEVRADMLYAIYQDALSATNSKVNVKSIIKEEEWHRAEMTRMLHEFQPAWKEIATDIVDIETNLFTNWLHAVEKEIA